VKGNFFDRLAARTLGLAPLSQPILPAKFSPAATTRVPPQSFEESIQTVPAPPTPVSMGQAQSAQQATPYHDDSSAISREVNSPPRKPQNIVSEIDASLPRERAVSPVSIAERSLTLPQPAPSATPAIRIPHVTAVASMLDKPTQDAPSRPQAVTAQVIVRNTPESSAPDLDHRISEHRATSNSHFATGPLTPVVRVTIGRVEVRAQFPAAPAPQPARRSRTSSLSLEDYLKQRSGGKR
jgi:hypothetical protein